MFACLYGFMGVHVVVMKGLNRNASPVLVCGLRSCVSIDRVLSMAPVTATENRGRTETRT